MEMILSFSVPFLLNLVKELILCTVAPPRLMLHLAILILDEKTATSMILSGGMESLIPAQAQAWMAR